MSLFYFFGGDETDRAGLGGGYIPRRWRPKHHSAPGRPAHHGQQGRPCQMQGRPRHAPTHTRPDAGHAAPVCTRYQTGHAGTIGAAAALDCLRNVSGKVYNFGRFILSIFIWINFAKSIDNPYIYGYNIISPDKYGLQPQYRYKTGGQNHEKQ